MPEGPIRVSHNAIGILENPHLPILVLTSQRLIVARFGKIPLKSANPRTEFFWAIDRSRILSATVEKRKSKIVLDDQSEVVLLNDIWVAFRTSKSIRRFIAAVMPSK